MKFDLIIQARYQSKRLPGKILLNFDRNTFLENLILSLKKVKEINKIILITPKDKYVKIFSQIAKDLKLKHFYPNVDEKNLISRYYKCAKKFNSENIIRITSDCPFINPIIVKKMIAFYKKKKLSFLTNNKPRFVPHGFDCEIMHRSYLKKSFLNSKSNFEKEHPTQWIYKNLFKKRFENIKLFNENLAKLRLTLDEPNDYLFFIKNKKELKKISISNNYEKLCKKMLKKNG